jgi:hypothetical protein
MLLIFKAAPSLFTFPCMQMWYYNTVLRVKGKKKGKVVPVLN